jgi:NIPSNAP protein
MARVVEIRGYDIKPGRRDEFHRLVTARSVPMLRRWNVDLVAYGPSLDDENAYYLIRAYESVEDLHKSQDAFYGSDEWQNGPREAILDCIVSHTSAVMEMDEATIDGLRRAEGATR